VNKTDLIDQLAELLDGNKKSAQTAVEGIIDVIQRAVQKGQNVTIAGFGVFEKRQRAARTARNPRTGEVVKVKKTTVPVFRPGSYFKDVVAGTVKLPKPTGQPISARAAAAAGKATARAATAARTTTRAPRVTAAPDAAGTNAPRARAAAKTATTTRPTRVRATEMKTTAAAATAAAKAPTSRASRTAAIKAEVAAATTAVKKPAARRARATAE
jgi:DNA-binding protein HU-beta